MVSCNYIMMKWRRENLELSDNRFDEITPVRLISITPDVEKVILFIARASSDQENTNVGLLRFLINQNHWSPYTLGHAVFEFNTSRTIAHQIIRHWSIACMEAGEPPGVQEFSQRYAMPEGTVKYRARRQADKNRQSSIDDLPQQTIEVFNTMQDQVEELSFLLYENAIKMGISKESARFLLPEATKTKLYLAGSIRSWIHYFRERCAEECQLEHRILAIHARNILSSHLPTIAEALEWNA